MYGTHHVLVLDAFHPSTTTINLERLFEDFRDRGFSIRWVNDTRALAVFRNPSIGMCGFSGMIFDILRDMHACPPYMLGFLIFYQE